MREFVFSIIGGLAVAAIIGLIHFLKPRVLNAIQNEPRLAAKWKTSFQEGGKAYHETVTITQAGRHVHGTIALQGDSGGEDSTYRFEGTFRHRILTATYCSDSPSDWEQGAFALEYTRNGNLVGQYLLFSKASDDAAKIVASDYKWEPTV